MPRLAAGVYTIWRSSELLYVGIAGRALKVGATERGAASVRRVGGLLERLNSHASGKRTGDQFCIYVADRLVLPSLSARQISAIGNAELSLDVLVKQFIRENLEYRYMQTDSYADAIRVEQAIRLGQLGVRPLLNPAR